MRCRIGISTDGGVTYTFGTEAIIIVGTSAGGAQNGMMTAVHAVATVPTDDIWVKVQIRLDAGTVANYNFTKSPGKRSAAPSSRRNGLTMPASTQGFFNALKNQKDIPVMAKSNKMNDELWRLWNVRLPESHEEGRAAS